MDQAQILKKLRGNRTQDEVAANIGVTKSAYSMYERGERTPRDEIKVKISRYYGVPVQDIFYNQREH